MCIWFLVRRLILENRKWEIVPQKKESSRCRTLPLCSRRTPVRRVRLMTGNLLSLRIWFRDDARCPHDASVHRTTPTRHSTYQMASTTLTATPSCCIVVHLSRGLKAAYRELTPILAYVAVRPCLSHYEAVTVGNRLRHSLGSAGYTRNKILREAGNRSVIDVECGVAETDTGHSGRRRQQVACRLV